jgi:hypothetical protein
LSTTACRTICAPAPGVVNIRSNRMSHLTPGPPCRIRARAGARGPAARSRTSLRMPRAPARALIANLHLPRLSIRIAWLCAVMLTTGCSMNQPAPQGDSSSVSARDVLQKCGVTYQGLSTLQAKGVLRDYRQGGFKTASISWDFARPDKCRLQVGMDVAIVSGQDWWTYDAAAGQYKKHNQFTRTPIDTAAYLLSKGIPFIMPALLTRGQAAFSAGRPGQADQWQLQGVGWHADAPCYVLTRQAQGGDELLRVWIDQDRFLLRGWSVSTPTRDGRERPVLECDYSEQIVDGKMPRDWLQLRAPMGMTATSKPAAGA